MRLLKRVVDAESGVSSLMLEEHFGENIPSYAILSHCWGPPHEEVSYAELMTNSSSLDLKSGYRKIWQCMAKAEEDGLQYLWADTCCIDKSSSAELSEGINSMFKWYKNATVCYAFLGDVPSALDDPVSEDSAFRRSRWFTRGWTLQELIAPQAVVFVAKDWQEIGTKKASLKLSAKHYGYISNAKRMSWAANRKTTRSEDRAYSLLGLFNVNMPAIYGEGWAAFARLQNEILKISNDHTIFAWDTKRWENDDEDPLPSMLAPWPNSFKESKDFSRQSPSQFCKDFGIKTLNPLQQMTSIGLRISLPVLNIGSLGMLIALLEGHSFTSEDLDECDKSEGVFLAALSCFSNIGTTGSSSMVCLILKWDSDGAIYAIPQCKRVHLCGQATVVLALDFVKTEEWVYRDLHVLNEDTELWFSAAAGYWYHFQHRTWLDFKPSQDFEVVARASGGEVRGKYFVNQNDSESTAYHAFAFKLLNTGELFFAVFYTFHTGFCCCYLKEFSPIEKFDSMLRNYLEDIKRSLLLQHESDWLNTSSSQKPSLKVVMSIRLCQKSDDDATYVVRISRYERQNENSSRTNT